MSDIHRWNFEDGGDEGVRVCKNLHDKGHECDYEPLTAADAEQMASQIAMLQTKLAEALDYASGERNTGANPMIQITETPEPPLPDLDSIQRDIDEWAEAMGYASQTGVHGCHYASAAIALAQASRSIDLTRHALKIIEQE